MPRGGCRGQGPLKHGGVDEGAGGSSIFHLQFSQDVPNVISSRVSRYHELVRDLLIAEARCR